MFYVLMFLCMQMQTLYVRKKLRQFLKKKYIIAELEAEIFKNDFDSQYQDNLEKIWGKRK